MAQNGVRIGSGRRSKYGATPTTVDGIRFHSAKEARRYGELKLLEKAGEITDLELQPRFVLSVPAEYPGAGDDDPPIVLGAYVADFQYIDWLRPAGQLVIEDCKGFRTPLYRWKKKHVEAQYGIVIRET